MSGYRGFLYAFILICITAKGSMLNAQDAYLDKLIDYQDWVETGAAFLHKEDTFYTFAVGFEENNSNLWKNIFSIVLEDGTIIDQRVYFETDPFSYSITPGDIYFSEDSNSIYAFGYKRDTISPDYGFDLFIMKLKLNGDTIWTKTHKTPNIAERVEDCVRLPGDSFACISMRYHGAESVYVFLVDENADIQRSKVLNQMFLTKGYYIVKAHDGNGFLMPIQHGTDPFEPPVYNRIWRLDSNFNASIEKPLPPGYGSGLETISKDRYLQFQEVPAKKQNDFHDPDSVTMYDQNWNAQWGLMIPDSGNKQYLVNGEELKDGSIILYGWGYTKDVPSIPYGHMIRISSSGKIVWQRRYFEDERREEGRLKDLHVDNDGWIYGYGARSTEFQYHSDAWLVKFDSLGCMAAGCDTVRTGLALSISNSEIPIYPNPSNGTIYIDLRTMGNEMIYLSLYDIEGREIYRKGNLKADVIHQLQLPPAIQGATTVVVKSKDKVLTTEKLFIY